MYRIPLLLAPLSASVAGADVIQLQPAPGSAVVITDAVGNQAHFQALETGQIRMPGLAQQGEVDEAPICYDLVSGELGNCPPRSLAGAPGPVGPAGPQGQTGAVGAQGPSGPQGSAGAQGETGAQGASGPQGIQGETGPAGAQGAAGPQGEIGPQGLAGPQGVTGQTGPIGPAGPTGQPGIAGVPGPAGVSGYQYVVATAAYTLNVNQCTSLRADCPFGKRMMGRWTSSNSNIVFSSNSLTIDPAGSPLGILATYCNQCRTNVHVGCGSVPQTGTVRNHLVCVDF